MADTAFQLEMKLKEAAETRLGAVVVNIQLTGRPLFFFACIGTTPDNGVWCRCKRFCLVKRE